VLGDAAAVPVLRELQDDPADRVRDAARAALEMAANRQPGT
jgi:hypothetical protein